MAKQEQQKRNEVWSTDDALKQVDEMFPEPLYESALTRVEQLCLVCGNNSASSVLKTATRPDAIVPLCKNCSVAWNFYGYRILTKIKPIPLLLKATKYFLLNPLRRKGVWNDVREFNRWQKKMRRIRRQMKR